MYFVFQKPSPRSRTERTQNKNQKIWSNMQSIRARVSPAQGNKMHPPGPEDGGWRDPGSRRALPSVLGERRWLPAMLSRLCPEMGLGNSQNFQCEGPGAQYWCPFPSERKAAISRVPGCLARHGHRRPFCGASRHMGRVLAKNAWLAADSCGHVAQKSPGAWNGSVTGKRRTQW